MDKKTGEPGTRKPNRYAAIIAEIFSRHFRPGATEFKFTREEFVQIARELGIVLPKNLGDLPYTFRFRVNLPKAIVETAGPGREWIIELAGRAVYRFRLAKLANILPNPHLMAIKIPDSTPEIIASYALTDEQSLLAKVRYNRLMDVFLGLTTYSLQNHLRTTVKAMGNTQIEIDEVYVGLNKYGEHFVLPVQAKGGSDKVSVVQTTQDVTWCKEKYPLLTCRPVSAQFTTDDIIALFELALDGPEVKVVEEKHYRLVPAEEITGDDLKKYAKR
ncbi:MAG: endonuclease [Terriglobia bacterium]